MHKGQIVAGDFGKIIIRVKNEEQVELGELAVVENGGEKIILQVYDLMYGSQISQQNLEMVAGMNLEEGSFSLLDESLRNYQLALLKPLVSIGKTAKTCKKLPRFFSTLREIEKEDLSFITTPASPFYLGNLRSGSKELDFGIELPGKEVFSHHVLIPASTGKGKSLNRDELVLIKSTVGARLVRIGDFTDQRFQEKKEDVMLEDKSGETSSLRTTEYQVLSLNPLTYRGEWKRITRFIRHKAPARMYQLETISGRKVAVTGDHNFLVLRQGELVLEKATNITSKDYIPQPLSIPPSETISHLNLIDLFKQEKNISVRLPPDLIKKFNQQELTALFQKQGVNYGPKIREFQKTGKISISLFRQLFSAEEINENLHRFSLMPGTGKKEFPAQLPLDDQFLRLLGYYVAEGYINNNAVRITNTNKAVIKDLAEILSALLLSFFHHTEKGVIEDTIIPSILLVKLLQQIGCGEKAGKKQLPFFIFALSNEKIAAFLKAYFEGDGSIYKVQKTYEISAVSKSEELINGLAYLLLRFGIFVRVRKSWKRATNSSHKGCFYYLLVISGKSNVQQYLEQIGFVTKGQGILSQIDYEENTNIDIIPWNPKQVRESRLALRLDQGKFAELCECSQAIISAIEIGKRCPSRNLASKIINIFKRRLEELGHDLYPQLALFADAPASEELAWHLNEWREESGLSLYDFGIKAGIYAAGTSKHYIENDLGRILTSKTVKNSPKIYSLGNYACKNLQQQGKEIPGYFSTFNLDYNYWNNFIKKAAITLNFPSPSMPKEEKKLGYYAREIYKGNQIQLKSLKQLSLLFSSYYSTIKRAKIRIKKLEYLLNLRWDRVKAVEEISSNEKYVYDFSVEDNETFYAGQGGMFVHNSNLMSTILWDVTGKEYAGMLVLDPHDEYYGRTGLGLKDHPAKQKLCYYTPSHPPPGSFTLKINLSRLKPGHFNGAVHLTDPQRQCLHAYYRKFKEQWIRAIMEEKGIEGVSFHVDTIAVVKRKLIGLLALELDAGKLYCHGIFDEVAGENTVNDICRELEQGKTVIIDTSYFSGALEILVGSLLTTEIFERYKYYKKNGQLDDKPVISVVLEEAPRVLGTKVLEQGSNIFETIAREGRKFKIGLIAITQLPSEIPKNILANMNTKIILGLEMNTERQAVIESSPQDLSQDNRNIASLDKGEALVSSTFTRFAVPVKIPLFSDFVKRERKEAKVQQGFAGIGQ